MNTAELIRMANQIARFFDAYPADEAETGIRDHIERFWEPRMRSELQTHISAGADGLLPRVVAAIAEPK